MEIVIILICCIIINYLFVVAKTYKRTAINGALWYFVDFKENENGSYTYTFCIIHKKQDFVLHILTKEVSLQVDKLFKSEFINYIFATFMPMQFFEDWSYILSRFQEEDIKQYTSSVANWENLETIAEQKQRRAIRYQKFGK